MSKLFVGRVSNRINDKELADIFGKYGKVHHVHMKQNFAFVHFENARDAEEAIKGLDGYRIAGEALVVEVAKSELDGGSSGSRDRSQPRPSSSSGGRYHSDGNTSKERPDYDSRVDHSSGRSRYRDDHTSSYDRYEDRRVYPSSTYEARDSRYYNRNDEAHPNHHLRMDRERSSRYDVPQHRDDRGGYYPAYGPSSKRPYPASGGWRDDRPYDDYERGRRDREAVPRGDSFYSRREDPSSYGQEMYS